MKTRALVAVYLSMALLGSRRTIMFGSPFRAPAEALFMTAGPRGKPREVGPALRVARRGREKGDLRTWQSWLEGCPRKSMGDGGRR